MSKQKLIKLEVEVVCNCLNGRESFMLPIKYLKDEYVVGRPLNQGQTHLRHWDNCSKCNGTCKITKQIEVLEYREVGE